MEVTTSAPKGKFTRRAMHDVIIIGAGFAGLSAAVDLAARGADVLVLEGRPRLGGRATSYLDKVTGELVDNGQHVLFGCYRETFRFLRRIGVDRDVHLQTSLAVSSIGRDNQRTCFQCPHLPPPWHLVAGVLEWDSLSAKDRLGIFKMLRPLRQARRHARGDWLARVAGPGETVRDWLVRHAQGEKLRELLWEPIALAALNQQPDQAAAAPFARVLTELCGNGPSDAAVGVPMRPLEQFYAEPARAFIETRGGLVQTKAPARVSLAGKRLLGVETGGEFLTTRAVIAAVPWYAFPRLFADRPEALAQVVAAAEAMNGSPIVTVNLWLDRQVLCEPFLGLPGRTMQWIFDKGFAFGSAGSHLSMVSSGATDTARLSNQALIRRAVSELREVLPESRAWRVRHATVLRDRQATFSLAPGQPKRPDMETAVRGLFLAGDWIDTGLPGTIESSVVSGHRAADAAFRWLER